jgi:hypothetical protein
MSLGYGTQQIGDGNPDGSVFGGSATEKIGFYGATPIARRANSAQATSLVYAASGMAFGTVEALQEVMNTLIALGLWKGGE